MSRAPGDWLIPCVPCRGAFSFSQVTWIVHQNPAIQLPPSALPHLRFTPSFPLLCQWVLLMKPEGVATRHFIENPTIESLVILVFFLFLCGGVSHPRGPASPRCGRIFFVSLNLWRWHGLVFCLMAFVVDPRQLALTGSLHVSAGI